MMEDYQEEIVVFVVVVKVSVVVVVVVQGCGHFTLVLFEYSAVTGGIDGGLQSGNVRKVDREEKDEQDKDEE